MKVNLDTNIFIAVKNQEPYFEYCKKILDEIENKKFDAVMSTIVFMEILVGFFQNNEQIEANKFASKAMLNYELISVDHEIARKAANIRVQYKIKLPDAIISATTLLSECDFFITKNKPLLKKLKIQKITPKTFVEEYIN